MGHYQPFYKSPTFTPDSFQLNNYYIMKNKKEVSTKDKKVNSIPQKQKKEQKPKQQAPIKPKQQSKAPPVNSKQQAKTKQQKKKIQVSINEVSQKDKQKIQTVTEQIEKIKQEMSIAQFLKQKFKIVVEAGLKEIVHIRPEDPIKYLGQYLISNSKQL